MKARPPAGDPKDLYELNVCGRVVVTFVSGATAEHFFAPVLPVHPCRISQRPSGTERVLKDHLQHLFPSHYFW